MEAVRVHFPNSCSTILLNLLNLDQSVFLPHEWTFCFKAILLHVTSCLLGSILPTKLPSPQHHFSLHFSIISFLPLLINSFFSSHSAKKFFVYKRKSEYFIHLLIILQWLSFILGIKFKFLNPVCKTICNFTPNYLLKPSCTVFSLVHYKGSHKGLTILPTLWLCSSFSVKLQDSFLDIHVSISCFPVILLLEVMFTEKFPWSSNPKEAMSITLLFKFLVQHLSHTVWFFSYLLLIYQLLISPY